MKPHFAVRFARVIFSGLLILILGSLCLQPAAAEMTVAPDNLVLDAKLEKNLDATIKCIFDYVLPAGQTLGTEFEIDLVLIGADGAETVLGQAVDLKYCPIDLNLIVFFNRSDIADFLATLETDFQNPVDLLMAGDFQLIDTDATLPRSSVESIELVDEMGSLVITTSTALAGENPETTPVRKGHPKK